MRRDAGEIDSMPIGPGKYDDLCTLLRERAGMGHAHRVARRGLRRSPIIDHRIKLLRMANRTACPRCLALSFFCTRLKNVFTVPSPTLNSAAISR